MLLRTFRRDHTIHLRIHHKLTLLKILKHLRSFKKK